MVSEQNHGLVFMMFLNRLVGLGALSMDEYNPRVFRLSSYISGIFLMGRDVNDEPFLGVPVSVMPHFTQVDWIEASICRNEGRLYLEARDGATQALHMAFGIAIRRERLNVFCVEGKEDVGRLRLNIKVFEQDPLNPDDVIFSDHHELTGIVLKEIDSSIDLGGEMDAEDARSILERSGLDVNFKSVSLTR
jgi:hypothetical protein